MTRKRWVELLVILLVGGAAALLPITRDEVSWWWATSHNRAQDYLTYWTDWPGGRHEGEARLRYRQRKWSEEKKGLIREAYQELSPSNAPAEEAYLRELRLRQEGFLWRQATNTDTVQSYQAYLQKYPTGKFSKAARARVSAIGNPSGAVAPVPARSQ